MSSNNQDNEYTAGPNTATACPMCGAAVAGDASRCEACGEEWPPPVVPPVSNRLDDSTLQTDCRILMYLWLLFSLLSFSSEARNILPVLKIDLSVAPPVVVSIVSGCLWFVAAIGAVRRNPLALKLGMTFSIVLLARHLIVGKPEVSLYLLSIFLIVVPGRVAFRALQRLKQSIPGDNNRA